MLFVIVGKGSSRDRKSKNETEEEIDEGRYNMYVRERDDEKEGGRDEVKAFFLISHSVQTVRNSHTKAKTHTHTLGGKQILKKS